MDAIHFPSPRHVYRWWIIATLLAALIVTADSEAFATEPEPEFVYYTIRGVTAWELREQLSSKGPLSPSGVRFDAYAEWHVDWRFSWKPEGDLCVVTHVETELTGTITLPQWQQPIPTSPALKARWDAYFTVLRAHELRHFQHGVQARQEIERMGRNFRIDGDCGEMEALFNREANTIIRRAQDADVRYDRETGHGRSEGAHFP